MWSLNRKVNILVDILLFLVAINIFHYGQLLLPIICLILFIDNKFKFKVNSWTMFIILCLFGISFLFFSYKLGFYSTMGLCLPMAYYIGSNIKNNNEVNIKKIIYIIAFGMAFHLVLNFGYELITRGIILMRKMNHYDIWTRDIIPTTILATNMTLLIGSIFYLFFNEKDQKLKLIGSVLFVIVFIYNIALGRRTPLLLIALSIFVGGTYCLIKTKKNIFNNKTFKTIIISFIATMMVFAFIYITDLFGLRKVIYSINIVEKFFKYGLKTDRFIIFKEALSLFSAHLFGGQEVSEIIGTNVHDLWFDTFDYAGIVPFILLLIHTYLFIKTFIKNFKSNNVSEDFKLLLICLFVCILVQCLLEPVMTGSSLFLISVIIIEASIEGIDGK